MDIDDFLWLNGHLTSSYLEIQGLENSAIIVQIQQLKSAQRRTSPYRNLTTAVLFKKKGPTHACRNIG